MFGTWHAYAKLRLHTDSTLSSLDTTSKSLSRLLRRFEKVTSDMDVCELPQEQAKAARRRQKSGATTVRTKDSTRKKFNLETYKVHSIGDYATMIRRFGTTDSYSTQIVSILFAYCSTH